MPSRDDEHTATTDRPTHTPDGQSIEWGPCCVCGAHDADGQRCPNCPGELNAQIHTLAFKAKAGIDPADMDPNVLVRGAHENFHPKCYVCSTCVNLDHAPANLGAPIKRA